MGMEYISLVLISFTLLCVIALEKSKHPIVERLLKWIPAILFAYIIPAIVTHLFHLDLSKVYLHSISKEWIMPLAIISVMSALSFKQLKAVGIRPILVFVSGSFAIAILPILLLGALGVFTKSFHADIIDQEYWRGLTTIVGSWIGGSTSQLILKELSNCDEKMFLVILVVDNILVNIWTILMFQNIKKSKSVNRFLNISDKVVDYIPDEVKLDKNPIRSIVITLGLCILSVILVNLFLDQFLWKIILLSLLGLGFGNFINRWNHSLVIKIGGYLIILIMAILGLKLNFGNFHLPVSILIFLIIWLILHYVVMILVAYMLKLNMAWVPIASMANVGGISTAPAVTKAYNEEWMPHAILLAILSMVTGTYWGMLTIYLFRTLF